MAIAAIPEDMARQVADDRRHLHAHPELGFQEHATTQFGAQVN